ncbi:autotransporter outer membrane beta-barrel domain-containing protein [Ochrobactrum sp. Marseille-Q0166]|uniref:autotransporter outer membrane beta-barrel domain-containing protein n=1 Tax=Ochrobactrum sp. Marseille-Q0166 TaxID=2761105 RepID=UPI00165541EE|nr:autotransporter outer membrane beta-barrel domain-containing protein [Ochrobactrum sp. Marseille-Q0166]MBC8719892.1 autotransporter outer membrane beta-barrel domain-containing protein [Ochrobactrum sp. Marseille-Q0166]
MAAVVSVALFDTLDIAHAEDLRGNSSLSPTSTLNGTGYGNGWGGGDSNLLTNADLLKAVNGRGGNGANGTDPYSTNHGVGGQGGAVGALTIDSSVSVISGSNGSSGADLIISNGGNNNGAGGGGGGAGVYLTGEAQTFSVRDGQKVVGGTGGTGSYTRGNGTYSVSGYGGGGGAGAIVLDAALVINAGGIVIGGAGGNGGNSSQYAKDGGTGGDGIVIIGASVENYGEVRGGKGGAGGTGNTSNNSGYGVKGGSAVRIGDGGKLINSGQLIAGEHASGSVNDKILDPAAIAIVGNNTTLELRAGSDIQGNVVVADGKTGNTLVLGGAANSTFAANEIGKDKKYDGFDGYKKAGTSTWSLTGVTTERTNWTVEGGALSIGQALSLGDTSGVLTLNGGALQTSANFDFIRNITVGANNGTIDVQSNTNGFNGIISGAGSLTKAGSGKMTVTGKLDQLGGVNINAGTLQIGKGGVDGAIEHNAMIAQGATLEFNHSNIEKYDGVLSGTGTLKVDSPGGVILTADSSAFTGKAELNGTTTVNGVLGASEIVVGSGGELDGTGRVIGNTIVQSGGTLEGSQGTTMTFDHNLTLETGSKLDLELGTASSAALFSVGGNLTLKTTINVSSIGGFGAGTYRIFDYTGNLLNANTVSADVSFGSTPQGVTVGNLTLVTSTAKQVSILNTTGATVNFWDGANPGGGSINGGSGTWSALGNNWTDESGNATNPWTTGEFAIFQGTGGTVTIDNAGTAVSASGLQFGVDGYKIDGQPLELKEAASATPIIRVGDGTLAGKDMTATISSQLQGTQGFVKTDFGTLILTGENTYTGDTKVQNGTLQIGDGGTSGSVVGNIIVGTNDSDEARLVYNRSDNVTVANAISGTGTLEKQGAGTLILTHENTYTGGTDVKQGVLQLGNGTDAGGVGEGDIHLAAGTQIIVDNGAHDTLLTQEISGEGDVVKKSEGVLTLEGDNTYTGNTLIDKGTVSVSRNTNLGDEVSQVVIGDGGKLNATDTFETDRSISVNSGTGSLGVDADKVLTVNNAVTGAGALKKEGDGTLILKGENTYAGGTKIDQGTLQIGDGGSKGSLTGNVDINDNAKLTIDLSKNHTIDGVISGNGGLEQKGPGTTTLTGENTYKGGTDITDGVLQVGSNSNLGDASGAIRIDGGALQTSDNFDTARNVELGSKGGEIDTQDNTNKVTGVISGPGQLIKDGSGTLILTGENTYEGGSKVENGILQIGDGGTSGSIKGPVELGAPDSALVIDLAKNITIESEISGSGGLTQQGSGTTTVTVPATYTGNTKITDGELHLVGEGSIAHSAKVEVDGVLDATGTTDSSVDLQSIDGNDKGIIKIGDKDLNITDAKDGIFAGTIEGTGGVDLKDGTQRLSGENTYTGGTKIDTDGTLIIGDGGTKGSVKGKIDVDGTLIYDRSDRYTVNPLEGNGNLEFQGNGTGVVDSKQELTGEVVVNENNTLVVEGAGDLSNSSGLTNNGNVDVAGIDAEDFRIKHLLGEESGEVALGDKNLVITEGDGSEYKGTIDGTGGLTVEKGKQVLTGENTYTGDTNIWPTAELQLGNEDKAGSITSNVVNQGILSGNGSMKDLLNKGTVSPGTDKSFGTLTVNGNYTSENGKLILHEELGGDNSKGDRLVIAGNTSGTTEVTVVNRGGLGAQTTNGIKVIEVGGQSNGVFNLNGDYTNYRGASAVVAGAYAYTLEKDGVTDPDGNWYLRSDRKDNKGESEYQAGVPVYGSSAAGIAMINRGGFASFGSRMNAGGTSADADDSQQNGNADGSIVRDRYFWGRVQGGSSSYKPNGSVTGSTFGTNDWTLQTGLDGQFVNNTSGQLFGSVWLDYTRSKIRSWSDYGRGETNVNGYGLGGAVTWYGSNGFYIDGQGKATWYKSDFESDRLSDTLASGVKSFGYALSLEAGQRVTINDRWSVTPQAQLIWSSLNTDSYRDVFDAYVETPDNNSLTGRIGLAANYTTAWKDANNTDAQFSVGGLVNVYRELKSGADYVTVSGADVPTGTIDKTWGEIGATVNYGWDNNKYSVYGKLSGATSLDNFGDSHSVSGNVGFRLKW